MNTYIITWYASTGLEVAAVDGKTLPGAIESWLCLTRGESQDAIISIIKR